MNSYSTRYQGTYSEEYVCNRAGDTVNIAVYWGHDCMGAPFLNEKILSMEYCYNITDDYNTTSESLSFEAQDINITNPSTTFTTICKNYTEDDLSFNCDKSLPLCPVTTTVSLEPFPHSNCAMDKSETNYHRESRIVQQCSCYDYLADDYSSFHSDIDGGNYPGVRTATACMNHLCNKHGIWEVIYESVDTSKPRNEWCASSMHDINITRHNYDHASDIYGYLVVKAGCQKPSGKLLEIEYCPDKNAADNILRFFFNIIVFTIVVVRHW